LSAVLPSESENPCIICGASPGKSFLPEAKQYTAWQARTLGPGGYKDPTGSNVADKIGDVKIEGNFEYRFHVIKILNAAMLWMQVIYGFENPTQVLKMAKSRTQMNANSNRKIIGQIAIGSGIGIRLDFNFFIIRLDGAFKVKDPAGTTNNGWMNGKKLETVLNFGIGYPF